MFATGPAPAGVEPFAEVREDEGLAVVLPREQADAAGLPYDCALARITLRVHSSLEAVGLTAAVSTRLAAAGMSANVIAGLHHDHLFVPAERGEEACALLSALAGTGIVAAVSASPKHTMAKPNAGAIRLIAGLGVEGDAHLGETVKHRSRVRRDPTQPNLRQVHLIHGELHDELRAQGFVVAAGEMGENVTTLGVDLLALPAGTLLRLGDQAVVEVTGLRKPCAQLDGIHPGLMAATLDRDADGALVRKSGIMGIVLTGGDVRPGDAIEVELPPQPHRALAVV